MAEESDEALELSNNEESGTERDDTKESMYQSTSESLQSGFPTVISLLDRLRSPTLTDLSRKRYLRQNPPPTGVKTGKGRGKGDPKRISACERVKSYPIKEFIVRSSKLFCRACKEVLALKKVLSSVIPSPNNTSEGKRSLHCQVKKSLEFRKPYMCMTVKPDKLVMVYLTLLKCTK